MSLALVIYTLRQYSVNSPDHHSLHMAYSTITLSHLPPPPPHTHTSHTHTPSHSGSSQQQTVDLLICDEAHKLKNADAELTKTLNALPARKRILLSGM